MCKILLESVYDALDYHIQHHDVPSFQLYRVQMVQHQCLDFRLYVLFPSEPLIDVILCHTAHHGVRILGRFHRAVRSHKGRIGIKGPHRVVEHGTEHCIVQTLHHLILRAQSLDLLIPELCRTGYIRLQCTG